MRWHINVYVTIRCYQYIISYCYFTYDGRINSNPYTITNSWYSLARTPVCLPNYNTLMNIAIATYFCTTIDGYIICMPYKNTPPICKFAAISMPLRLAHRRNKTFQKNIFGRKVAVRALRYK